MNTEKKNKDNKKIEKENPLKENYVNFKMRNISRSKIILADYNPRIISKSARAKLAKNIEENGLLMPLVWNERTGNLVSGHQRLEILDEKRKKRNLEEDYELEVAVVDLPIKKEKEQSLFFNNSNAMGEWHDVKLQAMIQEGIIDYSDAGFSISDLEALDIQIDFKEINDGLSPATKDSGNIVYGDGGNVGRAKNNSIDENEEQEWEQGEDESENNEEDDEFDEEEKAEMAEERKNEIKEAKARAKENLHDDTLGEILVYMTIIFKDETELDNFMVKYDLNNIYVKADTLVRAITNGGRADTTE